MDLFNALFTRQYSFTPRHPIVRCISYLIVISALILSLLTTSYSSLAADNTVPTIYYDLGLEGGWIPYQKGATVGQKGVFEEIIEAISEHSDIPFIPVHFPPKRAEKALKVGLVDFDFICLEWFTSGVDSSKFIVSDPLFEISEQFVTLANSPIRLAKTEDYFGLNIGTIAGYFYFNDDHFRRMDFLNEQQVIKGLKQKRFDVAILEKETAKHWANVHDIDIDFPMIHTSGFIRMRFRIEHKPIMSTINNSIKYLLDSGKLYTILDRHGLTDDRTKPRI